MWFRKSLLDTVTGKEYLYVRPASVVAHGGNHSMAFQGIQNAADLRAGVPVGGGYLNLRSNAIGVVSSPTKTRSVRAYRLGFWLWIERGRDPSDYERLYALMEDCDGHAVNNCERAEFFGGFSTIDLNAILGDRWHFIETASGPLLGLAQDVTFASLEFNLLTGGTGTNVYIDDVELDVCGNEVERFGGGAMPSWPTNIEKFGVATNRDLHP